MRLEAIERTRPNDPRTYQRVSRDLLGRRAPVDLRRLADCELAQASAGCPGEAACHRMHDLRACLSRRFPEPSDTLSGLWSAERKGSLLRALGPSERAARPWWRFRLILTCQTQTAMEVSIGNAGVAQG